MTPTAALTRHTAILRSGFVLIALAFFLTSFIAIVECEALQARTRRVIEAAFARIDLITRIARDVDQKRLLIDAHIFASTPEARTQIEATLAKLDADYDDAMRAYAPIPKSPEEQAMAQQLREATVDARPRIDRMLALSRNDQDAEAMLALESGFTKVDDLAARLVRLTRTETEHGLSRARDHQREATALIAAITLGGTALALIVAVAVLRVLRRGEAQVRRSAELLEQRNRELNAFAGRLAHDLRGPLTTIGLAATTLGESVPPGDKALTILERAAQRMNALIEDLLTLSRIDADEGGATASTEAAVAAVGDEIRPAVIAANGRLRIDVEPAEIAGSPGLLRQILWQVVENAVKYRRPEVGVEISIAGRDLGRAYRFEIADNGSGMTAEEVRRAYEPLFRGEQVAAIPGTGIGLTLVKRMVEARGGTVSIESTPSRGTTVIIELPRAA